MWEQQNVNASKCLEFEEDGFRFSFGALELGYGH